MEITNQMNLDQIDLTYMIIISEKYIQKTELQINKLYSYLVYFLYNFSTAKMKGYKNLLDQNSLHNHSSIACLAEKKQKFQKLFATLRILQNDVNINANHIRSALQQTVDKSNSFVSNLLVQINDYLERAQETVFINPQYKCFCDFMTNDLLAYVGHKKTHHKKQNQSSWNSSHFITFFGNALPYNPHHFELFQNSLPIKEGQLNSQLNEQRSKLNKQQLQFSKKRAMEQNQYTKIKSKIQESLIEQDKQKEIMTKSPNLVWKNDADRNKDSSIQHFSCGQCKKQFQSFKSYVLHLRKHDFMIHPSSSHIIVRKTGKKSEPLQIQSSNSYSNQKFNCPCKSNVSYDRKQFISHVLKWHKGITPKK